MIIPDFSSTSNRGWSIPSHLSVEQDADWSEATSFDPRYRVDACSFDLPLTSETLFTLSRGPFCAGTLSIIQSEEASTSDVIQVDVAVQYLDRYVLEHYVKVCRVAAGDGEYGVGIFTRGPRHIPNYNIHLRFDVVINLPKTSEPLHVKNLETAMPLFSHTVGDLAKTVIFDSVSLRGANTPIHVKSLSALTAKIETSNSPIEGSFTASLSLALLTTNARIKANVLLQNDPVIEYSELIMTTANGPIDGTIALTSTEQSSGKFKITANSALSGVNLDLTSAPENSAVYLAARTAMAPASVRMCKTFEGAFLVTTSMAQAMVATSIPSADPSGRGRER